MYTEQKVQNMKEGAFFDYFKCFSLNASGTISKLELAFKDELPENTIFDVHQMLKKVKTLLSSYEVLVLQIYDSCQFVEIPEFGRCIMKIFFQLMTIVRFMIKNILIRSDIDSTNVSRQGRVEKRCTIHASLAQSSKNKFYQIANKGLLNDNYKLKQQTTHLFKDLDVEMMKMQQQQRDNTEEYQATFERISKGREKIQQIQTSQNQIILSETVNMLYKKAEHINNFVNLIQNNMSLQSKETSDIENFTKIKEAHEQQNLSRFEKAKEKLRLLFNEHLIQYQQEKQSAMISIECQTRLQEEQNMHSKPKNNLLPNRKNQVNQIKKLKNENKVLQQQSKTLRSLINEKCQEYDSIVSQLRSEKIALENKLSNQNKSKHKSPSKKQSQVYLDTDNDNCSQIQSNLSSQNFGKLKLQPNEQGSIKSKIKLHQKVIKSKVKFQFDDRDLTICKKVVNVVVKNASKNRAIKELPKTNSIAKAQLPDIQFQKYAIIQEKSNEQSLRETAPKRTEDISRIKKMLRMNSMAAPEFNFNEAKQNDINQTDCGKKFKPSPLRNVCSKQNFISKNIISSDSLAKKGSELEKASVEMNIVKILCTSQQVQPLAKPRLKKRNKTEIQEAIPFERKKGQIFIDLEKGENTQCIKASMSEYKQDNRQTQVSQGTQLEEAINFQSMDLLDLFLNQQNASNFQYLNLTLSGKSNRYISNFTGKNLIIKEVKASSAKNLKATAASNLFALGKQDDNNKVSISNILTNLIYKFLLSLKSSKKRIHNHNYHVIKNWMRFPHSSVYRKCEPAWKQYEEENNAIQYLELKKNISRILKLHHPCKADSMLTQQIYRTELIDLQSVPNPMPLCSHWRIFLSKIGMRFAC